MLQWLEQSPVADWVASSAWGYPITLASHGVGFAIVVGVILIVCIRVLGAFKAIPVEATSRILPYMWAGFFLNLVSGIGLFVADAERFFFAYTFQLKILFIANGLILVCVLDQVFVKRMAGVAAAPKPMWGKVVDLVLFLALMLTNLLTLLWFFGIYFSGLAVLEYVFAALIAAATVGVVLLWLKDLKTPAQGTPLIAKLNAGLLAFMLAADLVILAIWLFDEFGPIVSSYMALSIGLKLVFALAIVLGVVVIAALGNLAFILRKFVFNSEAAPKGDDPGLVKPAKQLAFLTIMYWWFAVILSGRLIAYLA